MNLDAYYQQLVDDLRRRHIRGGFGWPGKPIGSRAASLYPNIAAELAASGRWLCTCAEFANVSPEIMAAVIEDGEELTGPELRRLADRWEGRGPGYLSAPVLQIVNPDTNRGKRRLRKLTDLIRAVAELPDPMEDAGGFHVYWKRKGYNVYGALKGGKPAVYADYWWACHAVKEALAAERSESRPRYGRTERRVTA